MKKKLIIAIIMALVTAIGLTAFTSCRKTPDVGPDVPDEQAATLPPNEREEVKPYGGPFGNTITFAANSVNAINGYFKDNSHTQYILENPSTRLVLNLSDESFNGLGSIENTKGQTYIERTMDTYMKTKEGETFFAGASTSRANLFDQGYYYYNLHLLDQVFLPGEDAIYDKNEPLELNDISGKSDMEKTGADAGEEGAVNLRVTSIYDPYVCFKLPEGKYKVADYDAFVVTMKCSSSDVQLFYIAGDRNEFSGDSHIDFKGIPDGKYHTYVVYYDLGGTMSKNLKAFRIDVGSAVGEKVSIKNVSLVKLRSGIPQFKLDRNYNMYTDKVNENVRFVATASSNNVDAVGTVTRIPVDNVEKIIIGDTAGNHSTIDGVDWNSAVYVGFDIKNAGVFGVILGTDETYCGRLGMEIDGGDYVLTQELSWGSKKLKRGEDIYMARRLYNDETHDFSGFLTEAHNERNPVVFTVEKVGTSRANTFLGYDQLTGAYKFKIIGVTVFDNGYERPLDEHRVRFTASPDGDARRTVYVRGETLTDGCLECAVVLGDNDMLLPIRVEVCKNFAHDGEELFYTDDDSHAYGLSIFPMVVENGGSNTLTLANLYEQWGNYRLKQVSSIRWHTAYYHLSLGVTETNCLNFYSTGNRLPDHRALSALYWSDEQVDLLDSSGKPTGRKSKIDQQPQHPNNGNHIFLRYTDSDGNFNLSENVGMTGIDAAGPDLADITLNYLSFDGKVFQTYRHVEMPSTDENRAFYEIDYEFLQDVTIADIQRDFSIYEFSGTYEKFGYLNKNGESVIEDARKGGTRIVELGSEYPYFDYFKQVTHVPGAYTASDVSSNLSFLLKDYDITIGGKAYTGGFAVLEGNNSAALTLNVSGKVSFKKGDHIRLNCILMPWGNFFSEDDANVRMVRVNTLLNPIKVEASSGAVKDDKTVPTIVSADGKTVEFKISGGAANVRELPSFAAGDYTKYKSKWERDYNVTVRIEGIRELCVPKIYELKDGNWTEYKVASKLGYDGYTVTYAADGTFTYGFVITMTDAVPRSFRLVAGE